MSVDDYRDAEGDAEERTGTDQDAGGWDPAQGAADAGTDIRSEAEGDAEERTGTDQG